ncbi:MAG: hypothetical protein NTY19_07815 [Planctomycetota bacterium]|nr:hypothetical protein [Planctomycetota bacterium]
MKPTLTDEMRRALHEHPDKPLGVVDPDTDTTYVLLRSDLYDRVCTLVQPDQPSEPRAEQWEISPGIRRSQEAFRRDLPKLLDDRKLRDKWVLYHGQQRLAAAATQRELIRECLRHKLKEDEYYVGKVVPTELIEVEEIDPSLFEFEELVEPPLSAS